MKIGEVSKIVGINTSAIRFYERHGLLKSARVSRSINGYRVYSPKDLEVIKLIVKFKKFGLELKEIKNLLCEDSKTCDDLLTSLDAQLLKHREMEKLIKERIEFLIAAKESCKTQC